MKLPLDSAGPYYPKSFLKLLLPAFLILVLAGCGIFQSIGERQASTLNLSGFPPECRRAFVAGCDRASAGGEAADAPPAKKGAMLVAQAWRDGFDYCKRNPQ
jgi:hypothetical protein